MPLNDYIKVRQGFQTSVNIAYDLHNETKVKDFIPTASALEVMENILLSTHDSATARANILIGAYGRGKSHIVLTLLALLEHRNPDIFQALLDDMCRYKEDLYQYANEYIHSNKRLLPVVIQGSSASLSQSFLGAIQQALLSVDLGDIMPETHFLAAKNTIFRWKDEFPQTYNLFEASIDESISSFIDRLDAFDLNAYEQFEQLHPKLTSGSEFNPFLGFGVIELYEKVTDAICAHGYDGLFVVYDEFSKYLESSIQKAPLNDIKMLQDFAEKCARSKNKQMHLLLISHKDISNYIDKLPKAKVDGWKGVSERFSHYELRNNFTQVYEVMAAVIEKTAAYPNFIIEHPDYFESYMATYKSASLFSDLNEPQFQTIAHGCYPLHPVTAYILPRLSELVAQNERTLFTFLSDTGRSTLPTFIRTNNANDDFLLITPDYLYDYFEPLFRKEPYTSDIKSLWKLTDAILRKVDDNPLHSSIIKTLSLIYMINQSEKLAPTIDVITSLFGLVTGEVSIVLAALTTLQEQKHVVYRKRSNHFLQLKSGANHDIYHKIKDDANRQKNDFELISALNEIVADNYLFPTQYNGEMAITRYFKFQFLNAASLSDIPALQQMLSSFDADGIVFGILLQPTSDIDIIQQQLMDISAENNRMVFILPKSTPDINEAVLEYRVISELYEQAQGDETLLAELDIYLDDLNELISAFIDSYQKPENKCSAFYAMGQKQAISRKAQLSNCLSDICTQIFTHTPVIKNETINQNLLTTASNKSRFKVLHALLSKQLEPQLGLAGSGQEVSFVRSLLLANGLIANLDSAPSIITRNTPNANIQHVLDIIDEFFQQAHLQELNFEQLYHQLIAPEKHIGLKRGVIPIFISLVAHQYKNTLIVKTNDTEFELSAPILQSINDNPSAFTASFSSWDTNKIAYVEKLEDAFQDHILESEKDYHSFSYLMRAMQHWYISLPQITKNLKNRYVGAEDPTPISTEQRQFMQALQQPAPNARKFLFEQLPTIFSFNEASEDTAIAISLVKHQMDEIKPCLLEKILDDLTELFADTMTAGTSLTSAVQDFIDSLSDRTKCHTFDGIYGKIMPVILENDSDSISFIEKIARATTGLRIDDWSEATIRKFATMIEKAKAEIYEYDCTSAHQSPDTSSSQYEIRFANNVHNLRSFNKVECSKMATLLQNELISALDEAGQSVSPEEKRQILIEIIERLC